MLEGSFKVEAPSVHPLTNNTAQYAFDLNGVHTDVAVTVHSDSVFIIITQLQKIGILVGVVNVPFVYLLHNI